MSEKFCFRALSLAVRIERVLESSLVECVVTLGYQVLISKRDLMELGSSIPLKGKGIPCMTFIPVPYLEAVTIPFHRNYRGEVLVRQNKTGRGLFCTVIPVYLFA